MDEHVAPSSHGLRSPSATSPSADERLPDVLPGDHPAGSRPDQEASGRAPLRLVTIPLRGEIDMSNARNLRQTLASVNGQDAAVVIVDLADVTFIDCAGLRPLLEARARLGHRLRLRNVPPQIRRMLVFSGTADALLH